MMRQISIQKPSSLRWKRYVSLVILIGFGAPSIQWFFFTKPKLELNSAIRLSACTAASSIGQLNHAGVLRTTDEMNASAHDALTIVQDGLPVLIGHVVRLDDTSYAIELRPSLASAYPEIAERLAHLDRRASRDVAFACNYP